MICYTALHYAIEACVPRCTHAAEAGASASQRIHRAFRHCTLLSSWACRFDHCAARPRAFCAPHCSSLSPVTNIKISRMLRDTSLSKHGIVMDIADGREAMPIPAIYAQTAGAVDNPSATSVQI